MNKNIGYNASKNTVEDLFEAGIVDSKDIVCGAVRNALGIASTLLTISSVITKPEKTVEELTAEVLQQKGLRM